MFGCLPEGGTRVSDISIVVFKEYVGCIDGLKIVNSSMYLACKKNILWYKLKYFFEQEIMPNVKF